MKEAELWRWPSSSWCAPVYLPVLRACTCDRPLLSLSFFHWFVLSYVPLYWFVVFYLGVSHPYSMVCVMHWCIYLGGNGTTRSRTEVTKALDKRIRFYESAYFLMLILAIIGCLSCVDALLRRLIATYVLAVWYWKCYFLLSVQIIIFFSFQNIWACPTATGVMMTVRCTEIAKNTQHTWRFFLSDKLYP